tara:strand:+ start:2133 stop:2708 length:576 start_codon:yes stop_codon:yes gene_type:complete
MKIQNLILLGSISLSLLSSSTFADEDSFLSSESQQLRFREAYSYQYNQEQRGIEVGVAVFGKNEQRRLLGDKVGDFVTLDIAITNNSPFRVLVNDFQVISHKGLIPREDLHEVIEDIDPGGGDKGNMRMSILRRSLAEKSLQNTIIEPNQSAQGIVFLPKKFYKKKGELTVSLQNLSRVAYLSYTIPFTGK